MRLFEFEAKDAFQKVGLPIPKGKLVNSAEKAAQVTVELASPVVIKVQVLAGGRGKAGGIKFAESPDEARKVVKELLGMNIQGYIVERVLIEERLDIAQEIYLGITVDRARRRPVAICSSMGGVDIEQVAHEHPEKIAQFTVDPLLGLRNFEARRLIKAAGFEGKALLQVSSLMMRLWRVFVENDAELTEINPLIATTDGKYIAADARLNVDDNSLFRHEAFAERVSRDNTGELTLLQCDGTFTPEEIEEALKLSKTAIGEILTTQTDQAIINFPGRTYADSTLSIRVNVVIFVSTPFLDLAPVNVNFTLIGKKRDSSDIFNATGIISVQPRVPVTIKIQTTNEHFPGGILDANLTLKTNRGNISIISSDYSTTTAGYDDWRAGQ